MTIQVCELLEGIRLPQNNVALLAATGNLFVLDRVDEAIDTLLMEIESALLAIIQGLKLVHVDETVQ